MKTSDADLNDEGASLARGGKCKVSTVDYTLTNGFYAGINHYDGIEPAQSEAWPAIIAPEVYDAAQERLNAL